MLLCSSQTRVLGRTEFVAKNEGESDMQEEEMLQEKGCNKQDRQFSKRRKRKASVAMVKHFDKKPH